LLYRAGARLVGIYNFLRRPTMSGVRCVIERDGRVLMVRHTYGSDAWTFPGGRRRRGEDPRGAARREIAEELGLDVPEWAYLGQVRVEGPREAKQIIDCFSCSESREPLLREIEIEEAAWFSPDGLPQRTITGTEAIARLFRSGPAAAAYPGGAAPAASSMARR
jgi:8-oxo-dGTP pyrophosphatase MutT (NUDIX family)